MEKGEKNEASTQIVSDSPHGLVRERSCLEQGDITFNTNPNPELFVVQPQVSRCADSDAESTRPRTLLNGDEKFPEGGLEAWLVVLGAWCGLMATLGPMNTIATLQTYVSTHQLSDYDEGSVGWIFSLYTALAFFCGVYIGPLFDRYGPRWLILAGTICHVAGLMGTSVCTEYWQFILSFGVLSGLGTSLIFTPSIAAVGHFFRERRGLASGLASTGGGVGGTVFPLMLTRLLEQVGWGWSLRIWAFICLALLAVANCLVRRRLPPAEDSSAKPDLRILGDRPFALLTAGVFLLEFGLFIPLAYVSSYALGAGFDATFAYQILPILNAASVVGRALPGYWADHIGPFNTNMASLVITIVGCYAVWLPFGGATAGLVVFAVMFGFATGNNISITPVCVGRLCPTQHYGRYYATCYSLVSVACLIGNPIAGAIVQATPGQQYWGLILLVGLTQALALGFMYSAKASLVGWSPLSKF